MRRIKLLTGLFITVTAALTVAQETGDAEKGRQLYFDHACYACHGFNGIGRHNIANRSSGVLINEQVFLLYLRARGNQNPRFPSQTMPHYPASSLSDEDGRHIYAHILTFVDEPPAVEDIPALSTIVEDAEAKQ